MSANGSRNYKDTWIRFKRAVKSFRSSKAGPKGIALFGLLLFLLVAINATNVVNSYVGRDFMSAIANRSMGHFVSYAFMYLGVFGLSTLIAVMSTYAEERLRLLWRTWQTRQIMDAYLAGRVYYRLQQNGSVENPDERISEDVKTFTTTTLSFVLMMLNGTFTVIAFSGVLWSISPMLFVVAVVYASVGSLVTVFLGHALVGLNYKQFDKEANFRSELIRVRDNAVFLATQHGEGRMKARLIRKLGELVDNTRHMISVNRNVGFFTTGYNYLIQIIPALIVAPFFIEGKAEFGVVTQSAMAFSQLMGAFSLIVTQFQSISSYAAVISRLGVLLDAVEEAQKPIAEGGVQIIEENGRVTYENVSLKADDGRILIRDLNQSISPATRVLITGASAEIKVALFKATAGLGGGGEGRIIRPGEDKMSFVPDRPYLPKSTLRELLLPEETEPVADSKIKAVLTKMNLNSVLELAGGLDAECDWSEALHTNQRALLEIARVLLVAPEFVFLDRLANALDAEESLHVLEVLTASSITYLAIGNPDDDHPTYFEAVLDLPAEGSPTWRELEKPKEQNAALAWG